MKRMKVVLLVMALLLLPRSAHALDLGSVRISFLEGDVQMRTTEAGDWVPAAVNTPLDEGDELWVPEGSLDPTQGFTVARKIQAHLCVSGSVPRASNTCTPFGSSSAPLATFLTPLDRDTNCL